MIVDLRENNGPATDKFKVFWERVEKFLSQSRRDGMATPHQSLL